MVFRSVRQVAHKPPFQLIDLPGLPYRGPYRMLHEHVLTYDSVSFVSVIGISVWRSGNEDFVPHGSAVTSEESPARREQIFLMARL